MPLVKIESKKKPVKKDWIAKAVSKNPGALHKELKVKAGEKIPEKKLAKAAKSENPKLRRQVTLARTLRGIRK